MAGELGPAYALKLRVLPGIRTVSSTKNEDRTKDNFANIKLRFIAKSAVRLGAYLRAASNAAV